MNKFAGNIITDKNSVREALKKLDNLKDNISRTLFVINEQNKLLGTLTDGDIRRGLLNDLELSTNILSFVNTTFKFLDEKEGEKVKKFKEYKKQDIDLLPIIKEGKLIKIIDVNQLKSILPVSALIMAGGKGERLRPLTISTPKPMLMVGDKPIIEHNIDRLISYGISKIYISVRYLQDKIIDYFGDGSSKGIEIHYIKEDKPLGTIGCLSNVDQIDSEDILVLNSDIITNINLDDFYDFFIKSDSRLSVASIPYSIKIPYAVLDTNGSEIMNFKEKPTYTYYSNGGLYFMKSSVKEILPKGEFYDATDLMSHLMKKGEKIVHFPILGYWLDIGRHEDFQKAQEDIKHINL